MFGTWKYDPETDEVQNLRRAYDPVTARASSHIACDRCHEKKLKCTGEKDGCERCIANSLRCEYTRSSSRSSRRGKKSHKTPDSRSDSASGSSSRRGGSSSKNSSSRHQSRASGPAASNPEEPEGLLSQLDFSMLGPDDGFDLNLLSAAGTDHDASSAGGYGTPMTTTGQGYPSQTVTDAGYHQWGGGQGDAGGAAVTSAAMYSQYATTTYGYDQQGFDESEYGQYEDYHNLDPRYWPQGGHR